MSHVLPPITRVEGESVSLSTTRLYKRKPVWAREAAIYVPVEARFTQCAQYIAALVYNATTYTHVHNTLRAGSAVTLNSMTTTWAIYLVTRTPINRFYVNVGNANANAETLTVEYWNGTAYTDASATDNTASGGATLAVDGEVTWTLPTDEVASSVSDGTHTFYGFVYKLTVSGALDSTVTVTEIIPGHENTTGGYLNAGIAQLNVERMEGVTLWVAAGTPTGNIDWLGYEG